MNYIIIKHFLRKFGCGYSNYFCKHLKKLSDLQHETKRLQTWSPVATRFSSSKHPILCWMQVDFTLFKIIADVNIWISWIFRFGAKTHNFAGAVRGNLARVSLRCARQGTLHVTTCVVCNAYTQLFMPSYIHLPMNHQYLCRVIFVIIP